jgi:hypothetical protein
VTFTGSPRPGRSASRITWLPYLAVDNRVVGALRDDISGDFAVGFLIQGDSHFKPSSALVAGPVQRPVRPWAWTATKADLGGGT